MTLEDSPLASLRCRPNLPRAQMALYPRVSGARQNPARAAPSWFAGNVRDRNHVRSGCSRLAGSPSQVSPCLCVDHRSTLHPGADRGTVRRERRRSSCCGGKPIAPRENESGTGPSQSGGREDRPPAQAHHGATVGAAPRPCCGGHETASRKPFGFFSIVWRSVCQSYGIMAWWEFALGVVAWLGGVVAIGRTLDDFRSDPPRGKRGQDSRQD